MENIINPEATKYLLEIIIKSPNLHYDWTVTVELNESYPNQQDNMYRVTAYNGTDEPVDFDRYGSYSAALEAVAQVAQILATMEAF